MSEVKEMNSSRHWLVIFAIIISVLVTVTLSLVLFMKKEPSTLLPEDTPQGIVQRYLIAIQEKDYQKAYNYLLFDSSQKTIAYNDWLNSVSFRPEPYSETTWKATLGKITINGDNSTVDVIIDTFHPSGLFGDNIRNNYITFQLTRINNKWFIMSPFHVYWIY